MKKIILLIIINILFTTVCISQEVPQEVQQVKKSDVSVELSGIPLQAIELKQELEEIAQESKETKEIVDIHLALKPYMESINKLLHTDPYTKIDQLSIKEIQKKETELSAYIFKLNDWSSQIDEQSKVYEQEQKQLNNLRTKWHDIQLKAKAGNAPKMIMKQILSVLNEIEHTHKQIKKKYDLLLTDLNGIATTSLSITNKMNLLKEAEIKVANNIFRQNKMPFIQLLSQKEILKEQGYFETILLNTTDNFHELINYIKVYEDKYLLWVFVVMMMGSFVFYFNYLYRKKQLFIRKESLNKKDFFFIKRVFSTFIVLLALANVFIFPDIPKVVNEIQILMILIPVFRIMQTMLPAKKIKYLYGFFILYFIFILNRNGFEAEFVSRSVSMLLSFLVAVFVFYIYKNRIFDFFVTPGILKFIYKVMLLFILLAIYSIVANLDGYILLANRVIESVFIAMSSSIIFYAIYIILKGYVIVLLRRHMATATNLIEEFSIKVEKNTVLILKVMMILWWFKLTLKTIGIYSFFSSMIDDVLELSWSISSTVISVESIVDFVFIIVITWFLSRFLGTLIEVEIFSRYRFPRGVPTAIKTVLNYLIIVSGTLVALSTLGITREQFTLVFGALGVGIGFGLRNIIANFVSGIIMVFERPIQIGDTIEVRNMMGKVQSIGARSSTVKTFDGSEVIIPNADFISKEIVNWTLSDDRRRKILEFKVDFDSDIDIVLDIMKTVALSHPNVLKDPEPLATFNGFGEYYLDFKLYFWLSENLTVAQSEIAIEIYNRLKDAGIKMPIPKHLIIKSN